MRIQNLTKLNQHKLNQHSPHLLYNKTKLSTKVIHWTKLNWTELKTVLVRTRNATRGLYEYATNTALLNLLIQEKQ